jgi:osmotically-inducible protein OsmY
MLTNTASIRAGLLAAAFAWMLGLSAGCGTLPADTAPASDEDIVAAVTERLEADPVTRSRTIGVQSRSGVVILSGSVRDLAARTRAVGIAQGTPGVKQVVDTIQDH